MTYEVIIEAFVLQCFIVHIVSAVPQPNCRDSDWDCQGSRELEFEIWSGKTYDDGGVPMDIGRNACAAVAEQYAEEIDAELWRQIEARQRRRAA